MAATHLKNVAIVGASGNVGAEMFNHLVACNRFNVRVVTRSDSKAILPSIPSVMVKKGSYDDPTFLQDAFSDQDVVILALGFMAMGIQSALIEAAAKAGVEYILPTEYAGDGMNQAMMDAVPVFHSKVEARKQIEELAKTHKRLKWIGIATNPWLEFSVQRRLFGIDIYSKKATLYSGSGAFNTSTLPQVGRGVVALLSLPVANPSKPRASLEHYVNNFVYISSALVTQKQLFEAAQRATGTTEKDWTVEQSSIEEWLENANKEMKKGNRMAAVGVTYAIYMGEGKGGNYEAKAREDREVLGLRDENLDQIMDMVVKMPPPEPRF